MPFSLIDAADVAEEPAACVFSSEDGGYRSLYSIGRGASVLRETCEITRCWLLEYCNINVFFIQNKTFLSQITFS